MIRVTSRNVAGFSRPLDRGDVVELSADEEARAIRLGHAVAVVVDEPPVAVVVDEPPERLGPEG